MSGLRGVGEGDEYDQNTLFENFRELIKIKKTSLYIFTRNISLFFCIVGNFLDVVINACWVLIQPLCVFSFVTSYVRAVGLEHILTKTPIPV